LSVLETWKAAATIQSFSNETNETTTSNIVTFNEVFCLPKMLASTKTGKSNQVQIWLDLSQEEAKVLMDSWAVSHVEESSKDGIAPLRAQGPRLKQTMKLARLEKYHSKTEKLERDQ
jgi:hypothetical protein